MKAFVAACVLLFAVAGSAHAATLGLGPDRDGEGKTLVFDAAPGEANRLTVHIDESPGVPSLTYVFRDTGAPLEALSGCTGIDAHAASCRYPLSDADINTDPMNFNLGDGDDTATFGSDVYTTDTDAGPGDDVVTGVTLPIAKGYKAGSDIMNGGGGHDQLYGGSGNDTLTDGDTEGAVDADVLDGGGGEDLGFVSYASRTKSVTVDLSNPGAPAGEPGEGDTLKNFGDVLGGSGNDTLIGDGGALHGGGGDDRLSATGNSDGTELDGGAGDDVFTGGPGADLIEGGAGHDVYRTCGSPLKRGRDEIDEPAVDEVIPPS